tara:strand:+ start:1717 stop:2721 length:1005 start_codon:yes stop_codon:yes gene_type:complete
MTTLRLPITPNQITKHWQPFFILSGSEAFLIQDTLMTILNICDKGGYTRKRLTLKTTSDWETFIQHYTQPSLFAQKECFILTLASWTFTKSTLPMLNQILACDATHHCTIFIAPKLTKQIEKKKAIQPLLQKSVHIPIWPLEGLQYKKWLTAKAKTLNLNLTDEAQTSLSEYTQCSPIGTAQLLEQLALLNITRITPKDIDSLNQPYQNLSTFHWHTFILEGHLDQAIRALPLLKQQGTSEMALIALLQKTFHHLTDLYYAKQQNNFASVLNRLYPWSKQKEVMQRAMGLYTPKQINHARKVLFQLEQTVKGTRMGYFWEELAQLLITLKTKAT